MLELLEQPESDRAATLVRIRTTAPQRAAALERLLQDAESEFLETPAWASVPAPATSEEPPERIGPWKIAAELGRGGMGTVFRGERDDGSFEQTVAVKLIRAELVSGESAGASTASAAFLLHSIIRTWRDCSMPAPRSRAFPTWCSSTSAGEPIDT